jgi:DNA-directed RNA polymerase specialized sigma24 family protein
MPPATRPSLLLRLRDPQDHAAWLEFVALYEPVVFRLLRKSGVQDADCRELGQEFFLIVSRQIAHWDPDRNRGSFRCWLRRVVRNLLINWLKERQRTGVAIGGSVRLPPSRCSGKKPRSYSSPTNSMSRHRTSRKGK